MLLLIVYIINALYFRISNKALTVHMSSLIIRHHGSFAFSFFLHLYCSYAFIFHMPSFFICHHFSYAFIFHMPLFFICLHFSYTFIFHTPSFFICLHFSYTFIFHMPSIFIRLHFSYAFIFLNWSYALVACWDNSNFSPNTPKIRHT